MIEVMTSKFNTRIVFPLTVTVLYITIEAALIGLTATQWDLGESSTQFVLGPLLYCLWVGFVVLGIASLFYWLRSQSKVLTSLPLVTVILAYLVLHFVPFTSIWLDRQFQTNHSEYEQVVQLVKQGVIKPNTHGVAVLPPQYQHLSKCDGEIEIEYKADTLSVFFYTFCGVLDNFSGFIYRSDNQQPADEDFGGDWKQMEPIEPHWYFAASS